MHSGTRKGGGAPSLFQVEVSHDNPGPHRVDVVRRFCGPVRSNRARQDVLFKWCELGFLMDHAEMVALKIVV
jgi:hypothetical protein